MKLSIIIPSFDSSRFLTLCLDSIFESNIKSFEVIVVDNNSHDDSIKIIKQYQKKHKNIILIQNKKNLGFAAANNQALRLAKGEFIFLLNADAFVEKEYIGKLLDFLGKNKDYASVTGKLLKLDENLKKTNILDGTGHILFNNDLAMMRGHKEKDTNQYASGEMFGVAAAASLYRKKMFDDIKISEEYFDEDFFAYFEDLDVDMRARKKGWKAYYLKEAIAYHYRGASSNKLWQWRQALKNRFLFIIKHESLVKIVCNLYWIPVGIVFFQKRAEFVKNIFRMFNKRKIIRKMRKVPNEYIYEWKQPYPYRKKIKKWMGMLLK